MNRTPLSRRFMTGVASLAIGLGGVVAIGAAPAQADPDDPGRRVVDCQTFAFPVKHAGEDPHPWRAVLEPVDETLDDRVVWQSGDWPADADLSDDPSAWKEGWASKGSFEVLANVENAPTGEIFVQYWDHAATTPSWRHYSIGGQQSWEWPYERPCGWVGKIEVTQPSCENPVGVIVIPDRDPDDGEAHSLTYRINGEVAAPGPHEVPPGSYVVTALRVGGVKNYLKEWTVEIVAPDDCPQPSPSPGPEPTPSPSPAPGQDGGEGGGDSGLPVTGASAPLIAGGAAALLALGGGLFLVARRRRVTFTA